MCGSVLAKVRWLRLRWRWRPIVVIVACFWLPISAGCATMIHAPVTPQTRDSDRGIRYFGLSPYLIAYSNGKGGVITEIKYLPDPAKLMSVRPDVTLSDVKATLEFENGALTTSNETGDATAVTKAVQTAVQTLGTALIAAGNVPLRDEPEAAWMPAPYVYRIVVKNDTVQLIGGRRDTPFRVSLLPQPAPKKEKE